MSHITGTFAFERQTNFQNYLKELGVPYVLRTLAGIARPVVTITKDGQVHKNKISCTGEPKYAITANIFRAPMIKQPTPKMTAFGRSKRTPSSRVTHSGVDFKLLQSLKPIV